MNTDVLSVLCCTADFIDMPSI